MSLLSSSRDASSKDVSSAIAYESEAFEQAVDGIDEAMRSGEGAAFFFVGASQEEKQEGLMRLSTPQELNLHRFRVPNLLGERLEGHGADVVVEF
ncbi:MAG: hypothetical protein BRD44_01870 [Bacteroidetes bacterium QS_7_67_15]|nr:MAG: hypothetical protein BRD44_01870 [Bacteroidetes bacterium QS_7_67_15]